MFIELKIGEKLLFVWEILANIWFFVFLDEQQSIQQSIQQCVGQ